MQQKTSIIIIEESVVWNNFLIFKKASGKNNNLWKKALIPLVNEENKSYCKQKVCYICKKEISIDDNKKYHKVQDHCHYN